MTTSDMIRTLCEKQNISLAELSRRIGQTPQNFNKKLKRGTVSFDEQSCDCGCRSADSCRCICVCSVYVKNITLKSDKRIVVAGDEWHGSLFLCYRKLLRNVPIT